VADLEGEQAVGLQECERLRDEAPVDVEAGGAREEGLRWLVVADLGVQGGGVGGGDVGRVGDDGVEGGFVREGFEEVGLEEADTVFEVVGFGVLAGDGEGFRGKINGCYKCLRAMVGERYGDGSGAGADVDDA